MKFNLTRLAIEALERARSASTTMCCHPSACCRCSALRCHASRRTATRPQTYRINGQIGIGRWAARPIEHAGRRLIDTAMRRVASPANRSLRMAARLNGVGAALPAVLTQLRDDDGEGDTEGRGVLPVNAFMPDGIVGTKLFRRVGSCRAATSPLDLVGPSV
jgi:hypothetical protein